MVVSISQMSTTAPAGSTAHASVGRRSLMLPVGLSSVGADKDASENANGADQAVTLPLSRARSCTP